MKRSLSLDLLRALAVFLVIGRHLEPCPKETSLFFCGLTAAWDHVGWLGVDLFFVLSGFLVSGLLFREYQKHHSISCSRFLLRRGLKIYPAFYVFLVITIGVSVAQNLPPHPKSIIAEVFFLQNYGPAIWNHTWSLAVEEHFYLLLLALLVGLHKAKALHALPVVFMALASICLALRIVTMYAVPFQDVPYKLLKMHLFPSHLRMDSLFFGVLISYFYHFKSDLFHRWIARRRLVLLLTAGVLLAPVCFFKIESPVMFTVGFTAVYLGCGLALAVLVVSKIEYGKVLRAVAYTGSHSYSIYLWHMPAIATVSKAMQLMGKNIESNWLLYFSASLIATYGIGILMSLAVEFPILKLRNRWFPSRS